MIMAIKKYINQAKLRTLKAELQDLQDYNLTSHNLNRFEDMLTGLVMGVNTDIRSNMAYVKQLQAEVDSRSSSPAVKGLTDDPWYKISVIQSNIIIYLNRINMFKSWMINFLKVGYNHMSVFSNDLNEDLTELKKLEVKAEMYKEMYAGLSGTVVTFDEYKALLDNFKVEIDNMTEEVKGVKSEVKDYIEHMNKVEKLIKDGNTKGNVVDNPVEKKTKPDEDDENDEDDDDRELTVEEIREQYKDEIKRRERDEYMGMPLNKKFNINNIQ